MTDLKRETGFTLVEVMIAIMILMIGLIGIIEIQIAAISQLAQAKHRTAASQLAAETLEHLKNVPVDRFNSATKFTDLVSGTQLVDTQSQALLYDATPGDGLMTWHMLPPYTADGQQIDSASCDSACFYIVAYGVEWGGTVSASSTFNSSTSLSEMEQKQLPETLPRRNQIYIEVWVGWVEPGSHKPGLGGTTYTNLADYYTNIVGTFPDYPQVFPKRVVVLKTLRSI